MNILEKVISIVSPNMALKRMESTVRLKAFDEAYRGASRNKRSIGTWLPSLGAPNIDYSPNTRQTLVARSRDSFRNQPLARAAIMRATTNVVGTGLRLQAHIDYQALGISPEEAAEKERTIEREFRLWSEDSGECDSESTLNFFGIQNLVFLSAMLSGDCFVNTPFVERSGGLYGLKLQVVEGDRVCNPQNTLNRDGLCDGIEYDKNGSPTFYHVLKAHPNDTDQLQNAYTWQRVPVFGNQTTRRRIFHLFYKERPGQMRGIPFLAPILDALKQLDRYSEAELMAAVVASMFTVFVKSESGQGLGSLAPAPAGGNAAVEKNANASEELRMGPGLICDLLPGESIETADPKRPNMSYDPFVQAIMRQIGAALEIPSEALLLSFQSSYSAARAALLEAWKFYMARRAMVSSMLCQPVYELWFDEAVSRGRLDCPGFIEPWRRAAWTNAAWVGPAKGHIDEYQAATAAEKRIQIGISTIAKEAAELGEDWDRLHTQRVIEKTKRDEAGLEMQKGPVSTLISNKPEEGEKPEEETQNAIF